MEEEEYVGKLQFSIKYEFTDETLIVKIFKAIELLAKDFRYGAILNICKYLYKHFSRLHHYPVVDLSLKFEASAFNQGFSPGFFKTGRHSGPKFWEFGPKHTELE